MSKLYQLHFTLEKKAEHKIVDSSYWKMEYLKHFNWNS